MLTGLAALTFTGLTARASTFVSNLDETSSDIGFIGYRASSTKIYATAFTTGNAKYVLNSVKAGFAAKSGDPANFEARLYSDSNGQPGAKDTSSVLLSGNPPDTFRQYTYTCSPSQNNPSACDLDANTTYYLVFSADRGENDTNSNHIYTWRLTLSSNETQTPNNNGWSIANAALFQTDQSNTWQNHILNATGMFSVDARQVSTLTATDVTHNAARLTIADHSGAWYYKYTSPDDGSCSSVSSGTTTASLSSLAGNTSYTFKAYSDSSCTTELTSASTDVVLLTQPAKPTTPTVTAGVGSGKLTISSSVSGGSGALKKWQYTTDNGTTWSDISSTSTTLTHTVTGLTNGTSYTFKVRAVNETGSGVSGGGTGPESDASTATAPQDETLTISEATTTSLKLTIANHPGDWYYKYTIPGGGNCSSVVSAGTTTATGLTANTSYTFKAYSDSGCTTELATAAATSTLALTELTASDATDTSLKLTIANHSGDWYYKYTIPGGGNCSSVVSAGTTTATGLTANTSYTFKAYSDSGCTTELATATAKSTLALTTSTPSDTSLTLTIANYSGSWYYKYTTPTGGNCSSAGSGSTTTVSGLTANTTYIFTAYSNNGCTTELATAASFTTPPGIPSRLYLKEESGLIKVWWQAPAGATTARLQRSQTNGNWDSAVSKETDAATGQDEFSGLTNGTTYYLLLSFKNANSGWGPGSILKATPGPVAFNATTTSQNRATLRLSKYDGSGNLRPENVIRFDNKEYREESIKNPGSARTDWSYKQTSPPEDTCTDVAKADGAEATVTGLSSGTSYIYKAYSGSGCTDANALGDEASFRTRTPAPPASPEISASAVSAATATLTIANYEGSWYYKRTAPTTGDHPYGSCSAVVTGTSVALTGLSASTSYSFTAYSDGGCTNSIESISFTTDAPPPAVNLSTESLTLTEGSTNTYTVVLDSEPTGTVTVALGSSDTTVATVSPASLSFTISNWEQAQTVTVTGVDNNIDGQDGAITISHKAAGGGYDAVADMALAVSVSDDDVRGVSLSLESLTLKEGTTGTYTVMLDSEPSDTVTIALGSSDTTVATVSPASLSFTTSNWEQAQTVTVTGVDNAVDGQDGAITISHQPSGGGYDAVADVALAVSVSDDDVRGVSLSPGSLTLTEGTTGTYTVVLDFEPSGTVTVALGSSDTTVATVSPASLSFTASNWEQAQTVTVTGVDNTVDGQDGAVTISHELSGGGYDAVADLALAVSVSDDDVRGVSLSPGSLTLTEGTTGTYMVVLDSEPTGAVTIALGSSDTTVATVSPASLSFTISNWEQAQSVTVKGVNDEIVNNPLRTATISHNTSGGDYDSVAVAAVSVTLNDDDTVRQEDKAAQKVDNAVLAQVVEQTAGATITAITNRVSSIAAGAVSGGIPINPSTPINPGSAGDAISLLEAVTTDAVELLWANQGAIQSGEWSLQQALAGRRFSIPLSALIRSQAHNAHDALVTAKDDGNRPPWGSAQQDRTGPSTLALWGSADYSAYTNLLDGVDLDGDSILFALGMDLQPTANLVTGLAVAFNSSTFDYSYTEDVDAQSGTAEEEKGTYEVNITTVNPYVSWSAAEQLDLWASVSYGRGERHLKAKDGATTSKQSDWISLAGGARLQLWPGGSATDRPTDRVTAVTMQPSTGAALDRRADTSMGMATSSAINTDMPTGAATASTVQRGTGAAVDRSTDANTDLAIGSAINTGMGSSADMPTDRVTATMQPGTDAALDGGADHNTAPGNNGTAAAPLTLSLKLEGATAQFMGVDVQQARLATEAQRRFTMDDGVLTTAVELGLRLRSEEAAAMELGGRLTWLHEQAGLSTTVHGRILLAGGEDHEEWGVGGRLRYQPGNRGEGLNVVLEPSIGDTGSHLVDLWALDGSDLALWSDDEAPGVQLRGELSYGIFHNAGILTPYSNLVLSEGNGTIGLGLRYRLPSSLQLDLRGEQQHSNDGATNHRIGLQLQTPL